MSEAHNMPVQDFEDGKLGAKSAEPGHHTEVFAEAAMEFLRQQTNGEPFLCYVAFKSPHDPRTATPKWQKYYARNLPSLPKNFLPQHPFDNGEMVVRDERLLPWPRKPQAVRREIADYYACISHLDEQVGRILEVLQATGLAKNTLVVFAGDNGLALGSHGLMGKQNLYEHSVGVPLILAGPGVPANRRVEALGYLLDAFPTLADLAGIHSIPIIDGRSLAPIFKDGNTDPRPVLFTAYRDSQRAVRDERWKLIRYPRVNLTQLFDLQRDPSETKNLANDPAFSDTVQRLMGLLASQQEQWGDGAPLSVSNPKPAAWAPPRRQSQTASPKKTSHEP
jgi:arylsulfatase A-like enzyme